jgi:hypothetical protein
MDQGKIQAINHTKESGHMNIIDSVLLGFVAGLVSLKVVLLASAAMLLLYALTRHLRKRKVSAAARPACHAGPRKFA